jgi:hypothetical protein
VAKPSLGFRKLDFLHGDWRQGRPGRRLLRRETLELWRPLLKEEEVTERRQGEEVRSLKLCAWLAVEVRDKDGLSMKAQFLSGVAREKVGGVTNLLETQRVSGGKGGAEYP